MHTDLARDCRYVAGKLGKTAFMGSGFGLTGRPGMTTIFSSQTLKPHDGPNEKASAG
jgi:hypothetical protein